MTGVVAALVADNDVEALVEQVDDFAFSFIAPLGADDCDNHEKKSVVSSQKHGIVGVTVLTPAFQTDTKQARLRISRNRASLVAEQQFRPPWPRSCAYQSFWKSQLQRWRPQRA